MTVCRCLYGRLQGAVLGELCSGKKASFMLLWLNRHQGANVNPTLYPTALEAQINSSSRPYSACSIRAIGSHDLLLYCGLAL